VGRRVCGVRPAAAIGAAPGRGCRDAVLGLQPDRHR